MIEITKQIIEYYLKNTEKPKVEDLNISNKSLLEKQGSIFVTLFIDGIVKGSSGNIQIIKDNIILELIENTINALNDSRFEKIKYSQIDKIDIRIDEIISRGKPIKDGEILSVEPLKNGILAIKTDYDKAAVILPNISGNLINGNDFIPILSKKLGEEFEDKNYIIYKIETKQENSSEKLAK